VAPKEIDLPIVPTGFRENPLDLREAAKDAKDNSSVERKEFQCKEDVDAAAENFSKKAAGDETSGGEEEVCTEDTIISIDGQSKAFGAGE
jgi:hypothetical protein